MLAIRGPGAIEERDGQLRQLHVIDRWTYLGTAGNLREARRTRGEAGHFDRDSYHILSGPMIGDALKTTAL